MHFEEVAPGRDFHAALGADFPRRADAVLHTHDFSEAMYVLDGVGMHPLNGEERLLRAGDLLWIRPSDRHTFYVRLGQKLHFINIAFRQSLWEDFRRLAFGSDADTPWETAPDPPAVHVPPAQRADCARLFQDMLRNYHTRPTCLALCRFWTEALPLIHPAALGDGRPHPGPLLPKGEGAREERFGQWACPTPIPLLSKERLGEVSSPPWLTRACLALRAEDALKAGVPRLVALCGVSPAHLARTLKASQGLTPTEFVNALRLEQAAILLTTTTQEIIEIASDCGFENLSYFYRLFRRRFGQSPRQYRLGARLAVMP